MNNSRDRFELEANALSAHSSSCGCGQLAQISIGVKFVDGDDAAEKVIDILKCVSANRRGEKLDEAGLERSLPSWFVNACQTETRADETIASVEQSRRLSPLDRVADAAEMKWSLADWLYWMSPEQRDWTWAGIRREGPETWRINVCITEWPYAIGSLLWLLRVVGAIGIDVDE